MSGRGRALHRRRLGEELLERLLPRDARYRRLRPAFASPGLSPLAAQQPGVLKLVLRAPLGHLAKPVIGGVGGEIAEESEGTLLVANGDRERPVGRQHIRARLLVVEFFRQFPSDARGIGSLSDNRKGAIVDLIGMLVLDLAEKVEERGEIFFALTTHPGGEIAIAPPRLLLHCVSDRQQFISGVDLSRRLALQSAHGPIATLASRYTRPARHGSGRVSGMVRTLGLPAAITLAQGRTTL